MTVEAKALEDLQERVRRVLGNLLTLANYAEHSGATGRTKLEVLPADLRDARQLYDDVRRGFHGVV